MLNTNKQSNSITKLHNTLRHLHRLKNLDVFTPSETEIIVPTKDELQIIDDIFLEVELFNNKIERFLNPILSNQHRKSTFIINDDIVEVSKNEELYRKVYEDEFNYEYSKQYKNKIKNKLFDPYCFKYSSIKKRLEKEKTN